MHARPKLRRRGKTTAIGVLLAALAAWSGCGAGAAEGATVSAEPEANRPRAVGRAVDAPAAASAIELPPLRADNQQRVPGVSRTPQVRAQGLVPLGPASAGLAAPLRAAVMDGMPESARLHAMSYADPQGGRVIFAAVTYDARSLWEQESRRLGTLRTDRARVRRAHEQCQRARTAEDEDGCVEHTSPYYDGAYVYLVRVSESPNEEPTLDSRALLTPTYEHGDAAELRLEDVDRDGRVELLVDFTEVSWAGNGEHRIRRIADADTLRSHGDVALWRTNLTERRDSTISFVDRNGDGHPDLVVDAVVYYTSQCSGDDVLRPEGSMPVRTRGELEQPDQSNCRYFHRQEVRLYSPESDTYSAGTLMPFLD